MRGNFESVSFVAYDQMLHFVMPAKAVISTYVTHLLWKHHVKVCWRSKITLQRDVAPRIIPRTVSSRRPPLSLSQGTLPLLPAFR